MYRGLINRNSKITPVYYTSRYCRIFVYFTFGIVVFLPLNGLQEKSSDLRTLSSSSSSFGIQLSIHWMITSCLRPESVWFQNLDALSFLTYVINYTSSMYSYRQSYPYLCKVEIRSDSDTEISYSVWHDSFA